VDYGSYTDASVRLMVELAKSYDPRQHPPEQLLASAGVTPWIARTPAGPVG
jgi:hypothetical protein